ncbi:Cys-tRNA(Pro) deacylase [Bacillus cereus]|uniref:Cys-tRNA(Pro) deacylase n=1 Tax=Bacillus cereus TaxID=1396 RepID=UPI000BFA5267|nr:Cys-tRNA(Pro) deacylase [Bacillus cereus]PFC50046.1 Cys-tRNA(Pro) deacylase [Bacillus cereus]PFJ93730.1 Cys-tRNA(Pro) deacylase [Bacillus cereus]PFK52079.1 Cys-tRNA(Pro) deacylase [Bacillus cereus]PGO68418.1 Cys-tRNA(Pro) deacylase [Bacillus cereus]
MKKDKTNAMRILDKEKIEYSMMSYDPDDGKIDGVSVAEKIGREVREVYKTLIAQGNSKNYHVFIIQVDEELNLKAAAKAVSEKKIEMIPVKDITKVSGYIRGGCSPVGMKKLFSTCIDESAQSLETMIVSGGKIGIQIELKVADLAKVTRAQFGEVTK